MKASTAPSIVALAGLLAATNVANNGGAAKRATIPPPTAPRPARRTLGKPLANETPAARAERAPDDDLPLACHRARQKQRADVGTGDEEDDGHGRQQKEQQVGVLVSGHRDPARARDHLQADARDPLPVVVAGLRTGAGRQELTKR